MHRPRWVNASTGMGDASIPSPLHTSPAPTRLAIKPGELGGKTAEFPAYLMDRTRIVVGKGQTYRGAWYDCAPALRIASMVCSVVSNTVVLTALT